MRRILPSLFLLCLFCMTRSAFAQYSVPPNSINFQAKVTTPDGNPVPDGIYTVRVRFYSAVTGGSVLHEQTFSNVPSKNGIIAILIGLFTTDKFDSNTWIGIKLNNDAELEPRKQIVSVPYAIKSNLALTVPDYSITSAKLADDAVTPVKLANDQLSLIKVTAGAMLAAGGRVSVGTSPTTHRFTILSNDHENLRLIGPGDFGAGARITFGDNRGAYIEENPLDNLILAGERILLMSPRVGVRTIAPISALHVANDGIRYAYFGYGLPTTLGLSIEGNFDTNTMRIQSVRENLAYTSLELNPFGGNIGLGGAIYSNRRVRVSGDLAVDGSIVQSSDGRLKHNIAPLDNALQTLLGMRGVSYDWKEEVLKNPTVSTNKQYGFIAQELQKVLPAVVSENKGGYLAVNYQGVIPILVEGIKAQQTQIEAQRREIDALEARLNALESASAKK